MYNPYNYSQINSYTGQYSPSTIKSRNNISFSFWERALFQRAASTIEFTLPEDWNGSIKDFFIYSLFRNGVLAVTYLPEFGTFFNPCSLYGQNLYYQPTNAIISNPSIIESLDLKIGENCELIKLTPDYIGAWDIIDYYAEKLSLLDNAINISLVNSKFAFILGAKTKGAAQAIKKILDEVNKGNPAVVYDQRILNDMSNNEEPFQFVDFGDIKNKYLTTDQLADFNTLISNFDAEIGIPSLPYNKKERLVTDEATIRSTDSVARLTVWLDTIKESMDKVNSKYNLGLAVKSRFENIQEVSANVNSKANNSGA